MSDDRRLDELKAMVAQIRAMSPPDRFRLVAELLELRQPKLAHTIASDSVAELGAAIALHDLESRKVPR